jgi:flagellar basal-body rod protein FlgF
MNYGLYLSASGVLTNLYRQDVFANNLANANTVGFKRDLASLTSRPPEVVEDDLGFDVRHDLLDKLGGGMLAGRQRIDFSPGAIQATNNPLDVALTDDRSFFTVSYVNPQTNREEVRFTRDGRFTRGDDGRLVTATGGLPVLNADGQPIILPDGKPQIDRAGNLLVDDELAGRIHVVTVPDRDALIKQGGNLFAYAGKGEPATVANPSLRPGYLEQSGVDPIKALMQLISATKAVTSNGNLIRYHDQLLDRAVNVLGRVA